MKTKVYKLITLVFLLSVSCVSKPQSIPTTILSNNGTETLTSISTKVPTPADLITETPDLIPAQKAEIPEKSQIAFSAGIKGIFAFPFTGEPHSIIVNQSGNILFLSPSWSPDGTKIAFEKNSKIYIINSDGNDLQALGLNQNLSAFNPSWSPDGENIAFTTGNNLFIVNQDGNNLHQLLKSSSAILFPIWSPDGKKLAFIGDSTGERHPFKIFLMDKNGKTINSITDAVIGQSHLSWSPDGNKIAFRSFEGCGDISVLDVKTGVITNLTNTPGVVEQDPAWSPDGNYIVFSKADYSPCEQNKVYTYYGGDLFIMRANGQNVTQLTPVQNGLQPSWWPTVMLQPNWKYSVTKAGSNLNVRESASASAKSLIKLQQGDIFTALDGPVDADNYHWWHIRTEAGVEGWCVDVPGWYMFESAPSTP